MPLYLSFCSSLLCTAPEFPGIENCWLSEMIKKKMPSITVRSGNLKQKTGTNNSNKTRGRITAARSRSPDSAAGDLPTPECPTCFGDEQTSARRASDKKFKDTPSTIINSNLVYYKNTRKLVTCICIIKTTVQCNSRGASWDKDLFLAFPLLAKSFLVEKIGISPFA